MTALKRGAESRGKRWGAGSARKLDVLALAAHRDDVEQTCGGTLLRMAEHGAAAGIVDLTRGEAGTRGSPVERGVEAERAAALLRVEWRGNLGLPDGQLEPSWEAKRRIAEVIRATQPRILIIPYPLARHPDHAISGRLGFEAAFIAGLKNLELGDEAAAAFRPHTVYYASLYANERPTFVVDITSQFEARLNALLAYGSQYADQAAGKGLFPPQSDVAARVEALARHFGMMVGVKYGEPFISPTPLRVGDLRSIECDTFTLGGIITPF